MPKRRIEVIAISGESIQDLAVRMVNSVKENSYASAVFDGIELVAGGGDDANDIVRKYRDAKK